jgi:PAS domain-containing serine/threonine kinase
MHIAGGSFIQAFTQGLNSSLSIPYIATSPVGGAMGGSGSGGEQFPLFPTAARNPNKAIITIDAQGSRILVANEMTCELFGYQPSELTGMKIQNLFTEPYRGKQRALMEQNISALGETILISGKVVRLQS